MWGILFTLVSIALAWRVLGQLLPTVSPIFRTGLALLLPVMVSGWLALLLSFVLPVQLAVEVVAVGQFGLGIVMIIPEYLKQRRRLVRQGTVLPDLVIPRECRLRGFRLLRQLPPSVWGVLAGWVALFGWLLYTHNLHWVGGNWHSAGSTWGDLALHLTYIHYFARQHTLSLVAPLYAQTNTTYPFLFDWYTSFLLRLGTSIQLSLIVSQWQIFCSLVLLLVALVRHFSRKTSAVVITLLLFFAGGGAGAVYFFSDWQQAGTSLLTFIMNLPWQYTNMPDRQVFFSTVIPDLLLPQRGFGVGLAAVLAMTLALFEFQRNQRIALLWLASGLLGMVPLFHFHSFLWAGGFWFLWHLYFFIRKKVKRVALISSVLIGLVPAVFQLVWLVENGVGGHFIRWALGWMLPGTLDQPLNWLRLLLLNFGLTILFVIIFPFFYRRLVKSSGPLAALSGYSWLVFVLCFVVSFQPWAYDNIKLMMISYSIFCLVAALQLSRWWTSKMQFTRRMWVVIIVVLATASGTLSVIREVFLSAELASAADRQLAGQLQPILDPTGITLTADDHNHPVPMLAGQPVVMGYRGWLWSQGVDYDQTATEVRQLYAGVDEAPALLKTYSIRYVFISNRERAAFRVNEQFWKSRFAPVYENGGVSVYDVTRPLTPNNVPLEAD